MTTFVDASATYAATTMRDESHRVARAGWVELLTGDEPLVTSNYIVVETTTLLQRRVSFDAARTFLADFVPTLHVVWVDETLHELGTSALLTSGMRDLSLVDCVSFALMRRLSIDTAFAFDAHFAQQGFKCVP